MGKLAPVPATAKGSFSFDEVELAGVKRPLPPTTMNVHRWTLEEDIAILKSVPIMGAQWAEICNRIIPHRDRGHIRKRYQVLERRIPKGITKMNLKRPTAPLIITEPAMHAKVVSATKLVGKSLVTKEDIIPSAVVSEQLPSASTSHAIAANPVAPRAPAPKHGFVEVEPSPDTHNVAALRREFSTSSNSYYPKQNESIGPIEENEGYSNTGESTRMGVEKLLGNGDDWSQASEMARLIEVGAAESNFIRESGEDVGEHPMNSPERTSNLPTLSVDDAEASGLSIFNEYNARENTNQINFSDGSNGGRKSILSSVMEKTTENALKRKSSEAFSNSNSSFSNSSLKVAGSPIKVKGNQFKPAGAPTKVNFDSHATASPSGENIFAGGFHPTSHATSAISFTLGTPVQQLATPGKVETPGMLDFFLSDKSRPGGTVETPSKTKNPPASPTKYPSPTKLAAMTPNTPVHNLGYGALSGPTDGGNSLFMAGADFDVVSALQDLSNSAPNTPSRLLLPPRGSLKEGETMNFDGPDGNVKADEEAATKPSASGKNKRVAASKPRTSFFEMVTAKHNEK